MFKVTFLVALVVVLGASVSEGRMSDACVCVSKCHNPDDWHSDWCYIRGKDVSSCDMPEVHAGSTGRIYRKCDKRPAPVTYRGACGCSPSPKMAEAQYPGYCTRTSDTPFPWCYIKELRNIDWCGGTNNLKDGLYGAYKQCDPAKEGAPKKPTPPKDNGGSNGGSNEEPATPSVPLPGPEFLHWAHLTGHGSVGAEEWVQKHAGVDTSKKIDTVKEWIGRWVGGKSICSHWGKTPGTGVKWVSESPPVVEAKMIAAVFPQKNVPSWQQYLKRFHMKGKKVEIVFWATLDAVSIGTDDDYLRVPLTGHGAKLLGEKTELVLPTPAMIDAIQLQSDVQLNFIGACTQTSKLGQAWNIDYLDNRRISGSHHKRSVSGNKKYVGVSQSVCPRGVTVCTCGIEFQGFYRRTRFPRQDTRAHGYENQFADYAQGVRLVAPKIRYRRTEDSSWSEMSLLAAYNDADLSYVLNGPRLKWKTGRPGHAGKKRNFVYADCYMFAKTAGNTVHYKAVKAAYESL